jgi:transcriptional regulator with GAF, ATPase, and Fis domain
MNDCGERHPALSRCVGRSPAIQAVLDDVMCVATARCPVLLEGESGTGKELIAGIIHEISCEDGAPFETVNCGAIPESLLESELFGHVSGAFTGAIRAHRGVFERASRGTVFLDEIGEMALTAQVRLLRVLQDGSFVPVGGERKQKTRARVIAATNRTLEQAVRAGEFRRDLFYRLNVFPVRLPPLRDRREDLPLLIEHFFDERAEALDRPRPRVHPAALRRLMVYAYPGNVRELQNIVSALLIEARGGREILDRHVSAVFSRHRLRETLPESADDGSQRLQPGGEVGVWVIEQLRAYHFNIALAERMLTARRHDAGKARRVPVCSRSGLTYYLQGEAFRALTDERLNLEAAALRLSGDPTLAPAVRRRLEKFLSVAQRALERGGASPGQRMISLRQAFPKLPHGYRDDLLRLLEVIERESGSGS